ncbi:uncharacterized protein LOC144144622 [Haemaphysalis longicornis]
MVGSPKKAYVLVAVALLSSVSQAGQGGKCGYTPEESVMLEVEKVVSKTMLQCVDNVILKYEIRAGFATAVIITGCSAYIDCFGKYIGKKPTRESRDEAVACIIEFVKKNLPKDLPTAGQNPVDLVEPFVYCFLSPLELPLENPKKCNAVLHWYLKITQE